MRIVLAAAAVLAAVAVVLGITARGNGSVGSIVLAVVVVWLGGNALVIAGVIAAEVTRAHRLRIAHTTDEHGDASTSPSAADAAPTALVESLAPHLETGVVPLGEHPGSSRH